MKQEFPDSSEGSKVHRVDVASRCYNAKSGP